jgi:hypothetical protein
VAAADLDAHVHRAAVLIADDGYENAVASYVGLLGVEEDPNALAVLAGLAIVRLAREGLEAS